MYIYIYILYYSLKRCKSKCHIRDYRYPKRPTLGIKGSVIIRAFLCTHMQTYYCYIILVLLSTICILLTFFWGPYLLVSADGYAFSIMISALHRGGHHQESKQLAKEYESENASYDLVMLNTSLRTYCSTNDMESVMRMLKKMDELNISPDNITFNTLIRYFCNAKVYHLAYKTVADMHTKGHQLNEVSCSR